MIDAIHNDVHRDKLLKWNLSKGLEQRNLLIKRINHLINSESYTEYAPALSVMMLKLTKCHEKVGRYRSCSDNTKLQYRPYERCNLKTLCPMCRMTYLNRYFKNLDGVINSEFNDEDHLFGYFTFTGETNDDALYATEMLNFQSWLAKKASLKKPKSLIPLQRWQVLKSTRLMISKHEYTLNPKYKSRDSGMTMYNHHVHSTFVFDRTHGDFTWTKDFIESVIRDMYLEYSSKKLNMLGDMPTDGFQVQVQWVPKEFFGFSYLKNDTKDLTDDMYNELNIDSLINFVLQYQLRSNKFGKRVSSQMIRYSFHKGFRKKAKARSVKRSDKFVYEGVIHRDDIIDNNSKGVGGDRYLSNDSYQMSKRQSELRKLDLVNEGVP